MMRHALSLLAVLVLAAAVPGQDPPPTTTVTVRQFEQRGGRWVLVAQWVERVPVVTSPGGVRVLPPVIYPAAPPAYPVRPAYFHPQAQQMPAGLPVYYPADPSCQTGACPPRRR